MEFVSLVEVNIPCPRSMLFPPRHYHQLHLDFIDQMCPCAQCIACVLIGCYNPNSPQALALTHHVLHPRFSIN